MRVLIRRRPAEDRDARSIRRANRGWARYPLQTLPLWYVLRSVAWIAVLTWIAVMVGKQLIHSLQWPTDWRPAAGQFIAVLLAGGASVWLWRLLGRLIESATTSADARGKNLRSAQRKTEGDDKKE